jgi:propionyl-CoA carboxylase alpha chain
VVRTCQGLGVRAVTVHSAVDAGALHVAEADESVLLGPAPPEESYLDARRVVEAARQTGAQALHPGTGALASDPVLARAVVEAGLVWVGAPADALERLAAPGATARLAVAAGLPAASAGAVGRRLSVPVLGLPDGRVVVLPEVDGSVQRRGQTVVEESPAPGLPEACRARVATCAAAVAAAAGHRGAGAVELLLVPGAAEPALLGVTPHLPAEHPVTELLLGIDLVAEQLRLAAGDAPTEPAAPAPGVALEVRVYAEDPVSFEPAAGSLTRWVEPPEVRVDSGYRQGDEVHRWYDPLLAKVVVHAPTRDEALRRARTAVDAFVVEGPATNLPVLARVLVDEAFTSGRRDTALVLGGAAPV